ncbi:MAG TPA: M20 aminoacylase family protein [Alcaligenes sp.]|nr:M20 aminoacylase family protein [Alcaligenes sp.]HRL27215.1 M20 aminoacylase family protein [Alcaligenes sp.]
MKLLEPISAWSHEIAAIRRDLHAHPELAFEETRTADQVAHWLKQWGIPVHRGLGITGVVGIVRGTGGDGPSVGLRADMDALPMQELNEFDHKSRHDGKMHACGHDGHTAMLLGAARYLAEHRDFAGTVYLIFQPAEEGFGGAREMINDGLFEQFPMQAVFGLHNWPGMPAGTFGVRPGAMMASSNTFKIRIEGKGAHGGMPNLGVDPVVTAVQLAQSLQSIVSRNVDPLEPVVLSITQIHAGSADNVIPNDALMSGTVRTFSNEALEQVEQRMRELTEHTCAAFGCRAQFSFDRRYPPTLNDPAQAAFCAQVIRELVGEERLRQDIRPSMGAEDFSFMLQEVPGCYVWLGNGDGDHRSHGHGLGPCMLHNGSYDFNDTLIPVGASYWVKLALDWLQHHR